MTASRAGFLIQQGFRNVFSIRCFDVGFATYGALWLLISIADYFAKDSSGVKWVHAHFGLFLLLGVAVILWRCRPRTTICMPLKDRDVSITLAIGDVFSFQGALVIGSNSTFDVSRKVISRESIQGQFTAKYYAGEEQLETEVAAQLRDVPCEDLVGRRLGKCLRYPIGSVVTLKPKERTGYLLAISHMNEHGTSEGSFDLLKQALVELWVYLGSRGERKAIVIPVLGSRFGRLKESRSVIVQEIIKSFVVACSERTFCEDLTIVLNERDVREKHIDFDSLGEYLKHVCLYTEFSDRSGERTGTPEV